MPIARTRAWANQYLPGWQALGRTVKRGERALTLCMPITRKVRDDGPPEGESESHERIRTTFIHKPRWFVLSQTVGDEFIRPCLPEWNAEQALVALGLEQISFKHTDGNRQGYARQRLASAVKRPRTLRGTPSAGRLEYEGGFFSSTVGSGAAP
jgi:hypothetical protein